MADDEKNQLSSLLQKLGFKAMQKGTAMAWQQDQADPHPATRGRDAKEESKSAWLVDFFALAEKKNHLAITQLDLKLDRLQFKRNVEECAKRIFGPKTTCEVLAADDGDVHVLFEFVRPGSRENTKGYKRASGREMPYGIAGYRLRFVSEASRITVVLSGLFGFGYVPSTFISGLHRHLADALGLRSKNLKFLQIKSESLFEFSFHVADVAVICLSEKKHGTPTALLNFHEALTLSASRVKDLRRTGLQTICIAEEGFWQFSSHDASHQVVGRRSLFGYVPLEVLEARERQKEHAGVDDLFAQGKFEKAIGEIEGRILVQPGSLFLIRRFCVLSILGKVSDGGEIAAKGLASEPANVLFLSARVNECLAEDNMLGVLENLSRLGEVLLRIVPQAEKARSFDVVLPELLGDAWHDENPTKAVECYSRILQKRGDLPRILRKLIGVARAEKQVKEEEKYLQRLGHVERRRVELAKIHRRLAEIRADDPSKLALATEDALLAVELDRCQIESSLLAKTLLIKLHRPEEAIQLLDGLLRDRALDLPSRSRARLEAHIAGIWLQELNRPDLAEGRYRQALTYDPENIDALRDLEAVHRSSGDMESLINILERQFTALERDRDPEALRHVLRSLVDLYRNKVQRPADALELYRRALDSIPIAPEDIDQLLNWPDTQIDWRSYYIKLSGKVQEIAGKKERGQYLCRLADLCRTKLNDNRTARLHYLDALHDGVIDSSSFFFLVEHLGAEKDFERLAKCYDLRLDQVATNQRAKLLLEYLNVPQALSDQKRDQLALEAYSLQPESNYVLQQRFTYYQSMDDVEGIGQLIDTVLSKEEWSRFQKSIWLEQAIQVLAACFDPLRFALMDRLYRELFDYTDDRERILLDAVRELGPSQDPALLSLYIGELLDLGVLPQIEEKSVRILLGNNEKRQAQYQMLRSKRESDPFVASGFARTAASIFRNLGDRTAEEQALARVGLLVPVDASDLQSLEQLTRASKHHDTLTKVLEKQINFESDPRKKYELLRSLGELYRTNLGRPDLALSVYRRALSFTARSAAIRWHMAGLAREAKDIDQEVEALLAFAADPHAELEKIEQAIKRLRRLNKSLEGLRVALEERTRKAFAAGDTEMAKRLVELLIEHRMGAAEIFKAAFTMAIDCSLDELAISVWWRGLVGLNSRSAAESYIEESISKWDAVGRPSRMLDCFRAGLSNDLKEQVNVKIYRVFLCHYGLRLFDEDSSRKKATVVLQEVFDLDPRESRVWMPLYFLLTDYAKPQERLAHLDVIVPGLERDPRPLRSFPLTLESLKAERAELKAQLTGIPRQQTTSFQQLTEVTGLNRKPSPASFSEASHEPTNIFRPVTSAPKVDEVMLRTDEPDFQSLPMVAGEPGFRSGNVAFEEPLPIESVSLRMQGPDAFAGSEESSVVMDLEEPVDYSQDQDFSSAVGGRLELVPKLDEPSLQDLSSQDLESVAYRPVDVGNDLADVEQAEVHGAFFESQSKNLPPLMELGFEATNSLVDQEISQTVDLGLPPVHDLGGLQMEMSSLENDHDLRDLNEGKPDGLPAIPRQGPQEDRLSTLYGNLFDDGYEVKRVDKPFVDEALPEQDDAAGQGSFRVDMTSLEREQTSRVSSVELAAALDMDSDADDELDLQEHDNGLEAESPTALMPSGVDGEGATHSTSSSQLQTVDWRPLVKSGKVDAKLTRKIINQAFVNEIEKHIALQSVAVLGASVPDLNNWHWRVWRKPEEFGYPLRVKDRYPESAQPEILQSSLAKLVMATAPVFVRLYRRRFTTEYLSRKLKQPVEAIERLRQPFGWGDGPAARCGFTHYADRIKKRGYRLFDLPGLQSKVFYEGKYRTIYLDRRYYENVPPSHLFHRILAILWAVRLHYFVPLTLNPQKDVLPVMSELGQHFSAQGISAFASRLRGQSEVIKALDGIDTKQLKELFGRVGVPKVDALNQLWFSMQTQVYSIILAETLDLVGLVESLVDRDLLDTQRPVAAGEVLQLSPYVRPLIDFLLKVSRDS